MPLGSSATCTPTTGQATGSDHEPTSPSVPGTAAAAVPGTADEVGSWSAPVDWPVVGVHVALLPNGKVLAYDSVGDHATESYPVHDHTRATVWDPQTGTHTDVRVNTGFNVFCSGLAHLLDGSVFLAGGNKDSSLNGIRQTHTFNPATNTWTQGANMAFERWYPSVTGLPNGEMLITEGGPDTPEVRMTNGGLRTLSTASQSLPLYPWLDVAPDGRPLEILIRFAVKLEDPSLEWLQWQDHGYVPFRLPEVGETVVLPAADMRDVLFG